MFTINLKQYFSTNNKRYVDINVHVASSDFYFSAVFFLAFIYLATPHSCYIILLFFYGGGIVLYVVLVLAPCSV